jgi:hypothetical protein
VGWRFSAVAAALCPRDECASFPRPFISSPAADKEPAMKPGLALMFLGTAIILAAVVSAGVAYERDKGRVAEFYQRNGNAAPLPHELWPEAMRPVEVLGFIAGGIMVAVGVHRSRAPVVTPAA